MSLATLNPDHPADSLTRYGWTIQCDGCGRFIGKTNPVVEQKTDSVFDPSMEQWYPEEKIYCSKCTKNPKSTIPDHPADSLTPVYCACGCGQTIPINSCFTYKVGNIIVHSPDYQEYEGEYYFREHLEEMLGDMRSELHLLSKDVG